MARKVRQPPTVSEKDNFRAREAFDNSVEDLLELVGSATVTVGSVSAGASATVSIPVPGAKADAGMTVQVGVPSSLDNGIVFHGKVSADDLVLVLHYNRTGSPIVLPEYTYSARVMP